MKLIVRAIMHFPGSHEYSSIKNLLALSITIINKQHGNLLLQLLSLWHADNALSFSISLLSPK